MEVSHTPVDKRTPRKVWTTLDALPQRVGFLLKNFESSNAGGFEDFERELHTLFAQTECAVTEEALARHDVDLPFVFIDGRMHRRACRCTQTYLTAAGPVSVTRTLYRARHGERAVAALERKVGIVEGYWTPLAARQGAMLVSHLTARDAEEVSATLGHMRPSKSSLDPTAQGAVDAMGGAARDIRDDGARGHRRGAGRGPRGGGLARRGDGADPRRIPRGELCDGVAGRCRRGAAAQRAHGPDAAVKQGDADAIRRPLPRPGAGDALRAAATHQSTRERGKFVSMAGDAEPPAECGQHESAADNVG